MQGDFWMGPSINQFHTCRIQFKTKMCTEFFLILHTKAIFFKNMQKIKKEEIRLTWPQTFSVVSTLPLLKIAHFVGHICLFIFLDSGKVPLGQIKHLSFSIGWFRKVTADKSRFSNICWAEKRTAYVTVRH